MKVFKFHPPYKPSGRCAFPETKKQSGVYLIKENDKLVYVGFSQSDLYKTLYRHFQEWTQNNYKGGRSAPPSHRVTYVKQLKTKHYTVRIIFCSPANAARLEKMLIRKHNPRDNWMKYEDYAQTGWDDRVLTEYAGCPVEMECPF